MKNAFIVLLSAVTLSGLASAVEHGPMSPEEFKPLAANRDASFDKAFYSDDSITVYGQGIDLDRKICQTTSVTIESVDADAMAKYEAEMAKFNAARAQIGEENRAALEALNAQFMKELAASGSSAPGERSAKIQEAYARHEQRQNEFNSRNEARVPKPPKREQHVLDLANLIVVVKNVAEDTPIIRTDPQYPAELSLSKQMSTHWEPAKGALDVYAEKVLPILTRACPNVRAANLRLGFHDLLKASGEQTTFFEVVQMDVAVQPNGQWGLQQIKGKGVPFRISATGVSLKQVIASSGDGIKKVWLDRNKHAAVDSAGTAVAMSNVQPPSADDLKLQAEALIMEADAAIIDANDVGCLLSGCETECQQDPEHCPGGKDAAIYRGAWSSCSRNNDWDSRNCQIIIAKFGQHSQSAPIVVPEQFNSLYASVQAGKAFDLNELNLSFASGLGKYLVDKCQILQPDDASVVNQFASSGVTFVSMGNNYMNPGRNIGTALNGMQALQLGFSLGENIACRMPESYMLAKGLVASIKASEGTKSGSKSRFVETCTPQFSSAQCQCLADMGRATIPDIHTRAYRRELIAEIIQRNPMLGLGIAMKCGINQY